MSGVCPDFGGRRLCGSRSRKPVRNTPRQHETPGEPGVSWGASRCKVAGGLREASVSQLPSCASAQVSAGCRGCCPHPGRCDVTPVCEERCEERRAHEASLRSVRSVRRQGDVLRSGAAGASVPELHFEGRLQRVTASVVLEADRQPAGHGDRRERTEPLAEFDVRVGSGEGPPPGRPRAVGHELGGVARVEPSEPVTQFFGGGDGAFGRSLVRSLRSAGHSTGIHVRRHPFAGRNPLQPGCRQREADDQLRISGDLRGGFELLEQSDDRLVVAVFVAST